MSLIELIFFKHGPAKQEGYIVLMSVILISAIGAAIAVSLILLGLANGQTNFTHRQSLQANALAGACAESALNSLRQDVAYAGGEVLNLGAGNCVILPVIFNNPLFGELAKYLLQYYQVPPERKVGK